MLAVSALLIVVTIIDGLVVTESFFFISFECFVNFMIALDLLARFRLAGLRKFFVKSSGKLNLFNLFDLSVVLASNVLFLVAVFIKHDVGKELDEDLEEAVLVIWCVSQIVRLALIAKKQHQARQNALNLINFENIVIDTDFATSHRSIHLEDQDGGLF